MTDRVCPQCSQVYGAEITYCPTDGARVMGDPLVGLQGRVIEGRFTIRELLAQGGMGAVYVATQHSMGRDIALKVLRPELGQNLDAVKRFLAESRLASRLTSPHTVSLYDFGRTEDGMLFIAMELLIGATLRQALQDDGPMDEERATRIATQVCESLSEAHELGIVHRDVKPDNVFLLRPGSARELVKVLDFGVAKSLEPVHDGPVTKTGMVCGTPDYMSPENVTGEGVSPASDVYSVGVLLYQMMTGTTPFQADSLVGVMVHHVQTPPRPMRALMAGRPLSPGMERLVQRCLSKRPADRPADASMLLAELLRVDRERTHGPPPGAAARARLARSPAPAALISADTLTTTAESVMALRRARGQRVGVVAGLIAVAVLGGLAALVWPGDSGTVDPPVETASVVRPGAEGGTEQARPVSEGVAPGQQGDPEGPPAMQYVEPTYARVVPAPKLVEPTPPGDGPTAPRPSPKAAAPAPSLAASAPSPATSAPSPATPAPSPAASSGAAAQEDRSVVVTSVPSGAEVLAGGRVLGTTPVQVTVTGAARSVALRKQGYEPQTVRIAADGPRERTVRLTPTDRTALEKAAGDGLQ